MLAAIIANAEYTYNPTLPKSFKKNKIDEKQKNKNINHKTNVFNEPKYDVKLIKKSI